MSCPDHHETYAQSSADQLNLLRSLESVKVFSGEPSSRSPVRLDIPEETSGEARHEQLGDKKKTPCQLVSVLKLSNPKGERRDER